jgi:hypothetical protein
MHATRLLPCGSRRSQGDQTMEVLELGHIVLYVRNVERSAAF